MGIDNNMTELIGKTPLFQLNRICEGRKARIAAKLEFSNPASSVKDRIGVSMIMAAEREGKIRPKMTLVESADSPVLSGGKAGPHMIQGIGAGFIPEVLNRDLPDEVVQITNAEAFDIAKRLAKKEGIFAGISSSAAAAAALKAAEREENTDKLIVVILPDTAERYISTALFE